ncbi:MAG TPA: hypothetical protein VN613_07750, partial [Gemmatimonadaceae bacterium]|nr:hypothetical protein [Gemmatimonadaceae bacterium]
IARRFRLPEAHRAVLLTPSECIEIEIVLADLLEELRRCAHGGMSRMDNLTRARYEAGEALLARFRSPPREPPRAA